MLRRIREKGIEEAEKELRWKGFNGCPVRTTDAELKEFSDKVKTHYLMIVLALSAQTIRDEFGFGKRRIQRFVDRFNLKADCMCMDLVTWDEMLQTLNDEVHIDFSVPQACKDAQTEGRKKNR